MTGKEKVQKRRNHTKGNTPMAVCWRWFVGVVLSGNIQRANTIRKIRKNPKRKGKGRNRAVQTLQNHRDPIVQIYCILLLLSCKYTFFNLFKNGSF